MALFVMKCYSLRLKALEIYCKQHFERRFNSKTLHQRKCLEFKANENLQGQRRVEKTDPCSTDYPLTPTPWTELGEPGKKYNKSLWREGSPRLLKDKTHLPGLSSLHKDLLNIHGLEKFMFHEPGVFI